MALGDTVELLEDIRERGSIPPGDLRFTDVKLLAAATKELREGCVPLLHQAKSEHLVVPYSVPVVSGQAEYRVPARAIGGGGLRDVVLETGGYKTSMRELPLEEAPNWGDAEGTPFGYYMRGYNVVLVPTPNVVATLHMPYHLRPNALVLPSAATYVNGPWFDSGGALEIAVVDPERFSVGQVVDLGRGTPAFETLAMDAPVTAVDPLGTITLQTNPFAVAEGDWVSLAGTSPMVQLPVEMLGLLAARTVRRALKAAGDERWKALDADVAELEARARTWLSPRNDGEVMSVSPLWTGLYGGVLGARMY